MKFIRFLTFMVLISFGCNLDCGKDVDLGKFELNSESIEDWYPYNRIDELTFENTEGEIITLLINERIDTYYRQSFRVICDENWYDKSEEYFNAELLSVSYKGIYNEITYSISIRLDVKSYPSANYNADLSLFDKVEFSSKAINENKSEIGVNGYIFLVASSRGVERDHYDNVIIIPEFADEIEINGKIFKDVWYYNGDGTPSLYVQQGQGIIAFLGLNNEVWLLK